MYVTSKEGLYSVDKKKNSGQISELRMQTNNS